MVVPKDIVPYRILPKSFKTWASWTYGTIRSWVVYLIKCIYFSPPLVLLIILVHSMDRLIHPYIHPFIHSLTTHQVLLLRALPARSRRHWILQASQLPLVHGSEEGVVQTGRLLQGNSFASRRIRQLYAQGSHHHFQHSRQMLDTYAALEVSGRTPMIFREGLNFWLNLRIAGSFCSFKNCHQWEVIDDKTPMEITW